MAMNAIIEKYDGRHQTLARIIYEIAKKIMKKKNFHCLYAKEPLA
jgi:hypothetical protein